MKKVNIGTIALSIVFFMPAIIGTLLGLMLWMIIEGTRIEVIMRTVVVLILITGWYCAIELFKGTNMWRDFKRWNRKENGTL